MMNLDISSLPIIKLTQRDIIASLTLLILIVIVVILLVGGSARVNKLEIPIDLIKAEIAAKEDISKEKLHSELKGIKYERKMRLAEKKRREMQPLLRDRLRYGDIRTLRSGSAGYSGGLIDTRKDKTKES